MLKFRPDDAGLARRPQPGDPVECFKEQVAEARIERLARAEILAGRGTMETYFDFMGTETAAVWSQGIYALLERDPFAGPLTREDFIRYHVHLDDQSRLHAASGVLHSGDTAGTELRYRIVTTGGRVREVSESTRRVASSSAGEVIFADIVESRDAEQAATILSQMPTATQTAIRTVYGSGAQAAAADAVIAAFDALRDCEQRRLTREMHDDFGQLLAAMKVDLALLEQEPARAGQPACKHVASLHALVDAMLISVRRIIADLPPLAIAEHGLFGALERLVASFCSRHSLQIDLALEAEAVTLLGLELPVYRIVQEALNNVIRHAQARNAWIRLRCFDGLLRIAIRDDGRGASPAQLRKTGSYGLAAMQERVAALHGSMTVRSEAGRGTCLEIAIPVGVAADAAPA